jgi:hypothetical protein
MAFHENNEVKITEDKSNEGINCYWPIYFK